MPRKNYRNVQKHKLEKRNQENRTTNLIKKMYNELHIKPAKKKKT